MSRQMRKLILLANATAVVVVAGLVTPAATMEPEFVVDVGGAIYPLRWGEVDPVSADLVAPYPRWRNFWAVCFKVGSRVGIRMHWEPGETPCAWLVTRSKLQSKLTTETYLTELACDLPGGHGIHEPDDVHWFPSNVPDFVEYAELIGDVVTCAPIGFGGWTARTTEVFVVLDEPKAPMDPAWVTFLRYSCKWARYRPDEHHQSQWDAETRTVEDLTKRETLGLFFQRPGMAYAVRSTRTQWLGGTGTFYLKALLDRWEAGSWVPGNCVDAAVMTLLANCSTGVDFMARGLTGDLVLDPQGPYFESNPLCVIGSDPLLTENYHQVRWAWHQVATHVGEPFSAGARVWDATAAHFYDLNGISYRNPPAHHPSSGQYWLMRDYWQKPDGAGRVLGVVYWPPQGEGTPRPYDLDIGFGPDWKPRLSTAPWTPTDERG
ncbi:MAG: hypothetical protein C4341_09750 [Armatimonadota bacterium]